MGDMLFRFNIGKYEFGMYRRFHRYFYNGYIRQFAWFYVYKAIEE